MHKRGQYELLVENVTAMLMAVAVIFIFFSYIDIKADNTQYFQEFQAIDLSLMADVVSAAPADLTVTYTNIKQNIPLAYEFREGGTITTILPANDNRVMDNKYTQSFGTYDNLIFGNKNFPTPRFIVFIKEGNNMEVRSDLIYRDVCKYTGASKGKIAFDIEGAGEQEMYTEAFRLLGQVQKTSIPLNEGRVINIINSPSGEITIAASGSENEYFACLLKRQIELQTTKTIKLVGGDTGVTLTVDVSDYSYETMGRWIGRAVISYAS